MICEPSLLAPLELAAAGVPDVSVVIPTRNRPDLLTRAIVSVLMQTTQSFEIIVVLDGEDGMTGPALERIADPRIRLLVTDPSVGGAEARNVGGRAAKGRYIALLDDDDEWLPTKLQEQIALADRMQDNPFVVVVRYLYRVPGRADELWPGHLPSPSEHLSEFLFSARGGFQTSTYLAPRTLFLSYPFTKGLKKHQDWDWFLTLASLPGFRLLVVDEPLSIYWVPLRSRESVSGKLDWKASLAWAQSRSSSMTRAAYASFLVKIIVRSAVIQNASRKDIRSLLRELLFCGEPTPTLLVEFGACLLVPETTRLHLRNAVASVRGFLHGVQSTRGHREAGAA